MKTSYLNEKGQLLIELLLAIALSSLLLPAILTGIVASNEGKAQEEKRLQATALLQETGEIIKNIRDDNWSNIATNGTYHPNVAGTAWVLVSGAETINNLTRQVTISDLSRDSNGNIVSSGGTVDPSSKKVVIEVSWTSPVSTSIQTTHYFQRFQNNASLDQTTMAAFNAGTSSNTEVINNAGGEVVLAQTAEVNSSYGNEFLVTGNSSMGNMTSNSMKSALRFTAQNSKTVNSLRVYLHVEAGTSPTYRYGIQANSSGNPSGTFLGSGTLVATSTGWKTIAISPSVTLVAGTTYHLVVEYSSGTISSSRNIALRRTTPLNNLYPLSQASDLNANTLFNNGSGWAVQNFQPVYVLGFNDGTFEGSPYETGTESAIFGVNFYGERFLVSGGDKIVTDISFYVRRNSSTLPAGSLSVVLQNADTNTTIEEGVLSTPSGVTTSFQYKTYTFTSPRTLSNGTNYRIFLKSTSSDSTNNYRVYQITTTNNSVYNSLTFNSTDSIYTSSNNSGSSWVVTSIFADIGGYRFTTQIPGGYFTSGSFESNSLDTGAISAFNYLMWSSTIPANTTLQFQVAINNDNNTWNYFGSDGTGTSYFTSASSIPLSRINGRYLRYKAFFTSEGTATPTLSEVSVNYSP